MTAPAHARARVSRRLVGPYIMALALCLVLWSAGPASAHRLKLFATVEANAITGYAFFVGGGRARGADLWFLDAKGGDLHRGKTGSQGEFRWTPPDPQSVRVVVNAGDGHIDTVVIERDRFAAAATSPAGAVLAPAPAVPDTSAPEAALAPDALPPGAAELIERKVEAAVARQIRPLLEAYAEAESRLRFNDIVGGVGMIIGLAGVALWASVRRRRRRAGQARDAPSLEGQSQ